jgi:tetratricopeptide (TPR) repeat protein
MAESARAPALAYGFAAVLLPVLGLLTWRQCGMYADIETLWRTTIARNPGAWMAYYNLGTELSQEGAAQEGIRDLQMAVKIQPGNVDSRNNLGNALLQQGREREAILQFQKVLEIQPHELRAQSNLAWVLATSPDASLRDGARAVELAGETDRLTDGRNPVVIGTLAAAYAEAGRFSEAVANARRALKLAEAGGSADLANALRMQIGLYQAGSPFHTPAHANGEN